VITRRDTFAGNELPTAMLKMVGFTAWDIDALSVGAGLETWCYLDGFISAQDVKLRSETLLGDKF